MRAAVARLQSQAVESLSLGLLTALHFEAGDGEACVSEEGSGVRSLTESSAPSLCSERISELGESANGTLRGSPEYPVESHDSKSFVDCFLCLLCLL